MNHYTNSQIPESKSAVDATFLQQLRRSEQIVVYQKTALNKST